VPGNGVRQFGASFSIVNIHLMRAFEALRCRSETAISSSSLLKNLEMERFVILSGRCWGGAVELDVIF